MENYFSIMLFFSVSADLTQFLYTLLYKMVTFIVIERLQVDFFHLLDKRHKDHLTGISCAVLCNITIIHCFSAQNSFRFKLKKRN